MYPKGTSFGASAVFSSTRLEGLARLAICIHNTFHPLAMIFVKYAG
jgi:hypothetical protein